MLLRIAHDTLVATLRHIPEPSLPSHPLLKEKSGIFCTLNKHGRLRGCIGFPAPQFVLAKALVDSVRFAALEDPRFPPVDVSELPAIDIEITVLTPPMKLVVKDPQEYLSLIEIGRDGLIVSKGRHHRGLLLPQVPVEHRWSVPEFLYHTCEKAGLPGDSWRSRDVGVERFQGKVFREKRHN